MGDRTDYQITIGGKMTAAAFESFLAECEAEGLGVDWEGYDQAAIWAAVQSCGQTGDALTLTAHEVNYGNADDVESFCRANALPYVKGWDAGAGYGPGIEIFDGSECRTYASTGIGNSGALLDVDTFASLTTREAVAEWFAAAAFTPPPFEVE